jgi:hypothetical protein
MSIVVENKIALLITWPRELDAMSFIIDNIGHDLVIIVDDFKYEDSTRIGKADKIIKELVDARKEFVLLSNIIHKIKYSYLFSTGLTFKNKFSVSTYALYLYGNSIGRLIDITGVSRFFNSLFGRSFTGGGASAKKYNRALVEKIIGEKTIRFPKGLDVSKSNFPIELWRDAFDVHLCHGDIDFNLVKRKFKKSKCIKVGYPKYDNLISPKQSKDIIYAEFSELDKNKPIIFWSPTHVKFKNEIANNIKLWLSSVCELQNKYNIIIRLHPKTLSVYPDIIKNIEKLNFSIDLRFKRELHVMYQAADFILADYGGSVFSAIYMKKNILLLNLPSGSKFTEWRETRHYLDFDDRSDIGCIDLNNKGDLLKMVDDIMSVDKSSKNKYLHEKYFSKGEDFISMGVLLNSLNV